MNSIRYQKLLLALIVSGLTGCAGTVVTTASTNYPGIPTDLVTIPELATPPARDSWNGVSCETMLVDTAVYANKQSVIAGTMRTKLQNIKDWDSKMKALISEPGSQNHGQ